MRIALIQHDIVWEDAAATRDRVAPWLQRAAAGGATLAVLPEMFAVGFSMRVDRIAEPPDGPTVAWLGEAAVRHRLALVAGVPTRTARGVENHAVVVDAAGSLLARYAKIHPFSFAKEDEHYQAGRDPVLFRLDGLAVGLTICYDLRFPELYRRLTWMGAEALLVIANWPLARVSHWSRLLRARAIENVAYVIGVNRTGHGDGLDYPGASAAVDPSGESLVEGGRDENVLFAELKPERIRKAREGFPFLKDARDDLFPDVFGPGGGGSRNDGVIRPRGRRL